MAVVADSIPSNFTDTGTRSTAGGNLAYDGNPATFATVSGSYSNDGMGGLTLTDGICTFSGFPAVVLGSSATLTVVTEGGIDSTLTPCEELTCMWLASTPAPFAPACRVGRKRRTRSPSHLEQTSALFQFWLRRNALSIPLRFQG